MELKNGLVELPETNDAWVVSCIITALDVNGAIRQQSAVGYTQSNLSVPPKSFTQALEPRKEVAVSAGPRRQETSQTRDPLFREESEDLGETLVGWDSVCILS